MADTPEVPTEVYEAAALAYELRGDPARRILYDTDTDYAWHLDYDAHATSQETPFRAAVESAYAAGRDSARAEVQAEAFTIAGNAIEHAAAENGVDDAGLRLAVMSLRAMADEAARIAGGGTDG